MCPSFSKQDIQNWRSISSSGRQKSKPPICLAFNLPYHLLPLNQQQYTDLQVQKLSETTAENLLT